MLVFGIVVIVGLTLGGLWGWEDGESIIGRTFKMLFGGALGVVCGAVIGVFVSIGVGFFFEQEYEYQGKEVLVSMRTETGFTGQMFLGTGSIESDPYYFYYINDGNVKTFKSKHVKTDESTIFEEVRNDAYVMKMGKAFKNKIHLLLAFPSLSNKYEFHVPEGSINRNFTI